MNLRTALAAAVIGASVSSAAPLSAQTFPVRDAVLQRIWSIGMDSSRLEPLAATLLDSIGPRLNGTPNLRTAQDWLVRTYASWGIEAKNERYGTWRGWRRGHSHVDLISPRVRTLDATMIGYSPGTSGRDVVAEAIVLPRFADSMAFVRWLPQARGKLVLASAPPATCRPLDDYRQFGTDESRRRLDSLRLATFRDWSTANVRGTGYSLSLGGGTLGIRLEEAGVAGLLTTRPKDALGSREIFETHNTRAPALSLSCEDYGLVFRLAERGSAPRLRLNLDSQSFGEQPAFNTIATIPGTTKPNEYVLLSAHFDSWDGASGATDNGTGNLIMLEAMRILKRVYPQPKRTIRVGHWTGEETGIVGSRAYREDHPEVEKGLHAVFNNDNGTGRIVRMGSMGLPNAAEHLRQWLAKLPTELRSQIDYTGVGTPGGGGTDDFSFYCAGVPTFGLGGLNWNYNGTTWHTNLDSYDKIVFEDLRSNATLVAMLAYLASEDATLITRERLDLGAAADSVLRAYGADSSVRRGPRPNPRREWPLCQLAPRDTPPRP
jgi:carboxypeptidase Q